MQNLLSILISLAVYLFMSYCFKLICEKAGTDPGLLIWIPLLQFFPILKAAGLAAWTFVLLLVPGVNAVFMIIMFVRLIKAVGKNPWLVLLLFVPIVNVFFIPYLAFSNNITQPEAQLSNEAISSTGAASSSQMSSEGIASAPLTE